ncbi:MAG: DUF1127 domain-containing protein [Candidatus Bathyarchaeia archaeon]
MKAIEELSSLSDYQLRDIGMSRSEIIYNIRKSRLDGR